MVMSESRYERVCFGREELDPWRRQVRARDVMKGQRVGRRAVGYVEAKAEELGIDREEQGRWGEEMSVQNGEEKAGDVCVALKEKNKKRINDGTEEG